MAFGRQRHARRILQIQRPGRPRHRHHCPGQSPQRETAMQQLNDRGIGLVAQQLVSHAESRGIQRSGRRHALACLPRSACVLEQRLQAGGHHLKDMHMRYGLLIAGTAGTLPITSGIIRYRRGTGTHRAPATGAIFGSGRHATATHQRTPLLHDLALQRLAFLGRHIHELHALPRLQQRRRGACQIPHRHVGGTNELPPPGRGTRVHGTEGTGQPDGARRNARARAGATRHVEYRIAPRQIGKARCKAGKRHLPDRSRVPPHQLLHRQPQMIGHFGQILAVVADRNAHQRSLPCLPLPALPRCNAGHQSGQRTDPWQEMHQDGARRRYQFGHPLDRIRLQCVEERQGFIQVGQLHQDGIEIDGQQTHVRFLFSLSRSGKRCQRHTGISQNPAHRACHFHRIGTVTVHADRICLHLRQAAIDGFHHTLAHQP